MDDYGREEMLRRVNELSEKLARMETDLEQMGARLGETMWRDKEDAKRIEDALLGLDKSLGYKQLLLIKLMEECGEVIPEISKALHFGAEEIQDGQKLTNAQRVERELADLLGVVRMLCDAGLLKWNAIFNGDAHAAKREKVLKWLEFSAERGIYRKGVKK